MNIQLTHRRHEDDAVKVRFRNGFLAEVVERRRRVLFDRRLQLCGSATKMDVEFAIDEYGVDAFF